MPRFLRAKNFLLFLHISAILRVVQSQGLIQENCQDLSILAEQMNMLPTKNFINKFLNHNFVQVSPMFYPDIFQGIYLEKIVTIRVFEMSRAAEVEGYFRSYEKLLQVKLTNEIINCFYDKQSILIIYQGQYKGMFQYARKFIA